MKLSLLIVLLLVSGCLLGLEQPATTEPGVPPSTGLKLIDIALTPEDLGFVGWVPSSENLSADVYERRFVRVDSSFGGTSRLINRVHRYDDPEQAMIDYQAASDRLQMDLIVFHPAIGEESVMWITKDEGYLLFLRDIFLVEIKITTPGLLEREFLEGLGTRIDSKIIS